VARVVTLTQFTLDEIDAVLARHEAKAHRKP
jgi:hypothetical protein